MQVAHCHSSSPASISASFSSVSAWCLVEAWIPRKHSCTSVSPSIQAFQIRWPLSSPRVFFVSPSIQAFQIRWPLSSPRVFAIGSSSSSLTRMAACHPSLVQLKSASPVVVLRSSVTTFAQDAAALHASMLDLGLWFSHHSSTLSLASSHLFVSLSSSSNAC